MAVLRTLGGGPVLALGVVLLAAPAAEAGRGGPDRGGVEWVDSLEAGGEVVYEWVDISAEGTALDIGDDATSGAVEIGFPFEHYGEEYTLVYVGSNGYLTFLSDLVEGFDGNCPVPSVDAPNGSVLVFYQDLDPTAPTSGPILHATLGEEGTRRFVVTWQGVDLFQGDDPEDPFGSDPVTFQVVLFEESGEIQVNVQDSGELAGGPRWSANATIGVEDETGETGVGLCPGDIADDYAVRFGPSTGVALFPTSGRQVGTPGATTTFELELVNFGDTEVSASIGLVSHAGWDVAARDASPTLPPGGVSSPLLVDVEVPTSAEPGASDQIDLTVTAGGTTLEAVLTVAVTFPDDEWQVVADIPEPLRDVEVVSDGRYLYAIGGAYLDMRVGENGTWTPVASTSRFDPELNGWQDGEVAELPVPLTQGTACSMEGRIYYVGGFDGAAADGSHWSFSPDVYIYDIAADEWSTGTPPPHAVSDANVVCHDPSNRIYVINGYADLDGDGDFIGRADGGGDWREPHTFVYDALRDDWGERAPSDEGVSGAGTGIIDGRIYLAGGAYDDADDPSSSGWITRATRIYDTVSDRWSSGPRLAAFRSDTVGAVFRDQLCVFGGDGSEGLFDTWECLSGSLWIEQVDLLTFPRDSVGAAVLGDYVYVVAGDAGEWVTDRAERWPSGELPPPWTGDADADTDVDADSDGDVDADADTDVDADADGDGDGGEDGDEGSSCGCRAAGASPASPAVLVLALVASLRGLRRGQRRGR